MTVCYLCGQSVDASVSTGDHVIPRTLLGKQAPKAKGLDYGGRLRTHAECNNRFGDETYVRKALQLWGALHDSNATFSRPAPGNPKARVLVLNEEKLPGFRPRDLRFFGIHDARNDSMSGFDDPGYYADKPQADLRRTMRCTALSVLAKSAAALLVKRYLADVPSNWDIVCIPRMGDVTRVDLSSFFGETRPFASDIRVWAKAFEAGSRLLLYATGTVMVWFFFLMDGDRNLVDEIRRRSPSDQCFQFQGRTLMDLVGYDWRPAG